MLLLFSVCCANKKQQSSVAKTTREDGERERSFHTMRLKFLDDDDDDDDNMQRNGPYSQMNDDFHILGDRRFGENK